MKNLILVHLESLSNLIFNENRHLFPNLERAFNKGTYYRNYYSSATSTLMVIEDICYGGMNREACTQLGNKSVVSKKEESLFDVLGEKGYEVRGIIWPQIDTYPKMIERNVLGHNVDIETPQNYNAYIKSIEESILGDGPFALFIGNFVSHISYRSEGSKKIDAYYKWQNGYKMIDDTCGSIMEFLNKCHKKESTILVFYGDHGDDLWGHELHNGYTHAIEPYSHLIHTPLIVNDTLQLKTVSDELLSAVDLKNKILDLLFDRQNSNNKREYIFARNVFANQKADIYSLNKGYAIVKEDYLMMVSPKGLELYNIHMDVTNSCNILEFFKMDSKGNIRFVSKLKQIRSMHFRDFFTDQEIRYVVQIYRRMRSILLYETEKLYKSVHKENFERDSELAFNKIHRLHYYNMYNHALGNVIKKFIQH